MDNPKIPKDSALPAETPEDRDLTAAEIAVIEQELKENSRFEFHYSHRIPLVTGPSNFLDGIDDIRLVQAYAEGLTTTFDRMVQEGWGNPQYAGAKIPVYIRHMGAAAIRWNIRPDPPTIFLRSELDHVLDHKLVFKIAKAAATHEAVHIFTFCHLPQAYINYPLWSWFDEATASYLERKYNGHISTLYHKHALVWVNLPHLAIELERVGDTFFDQKPQKHQAPGVESAKKTESEYESVEYPPTDLNYYAAWFAESLEKTYYEGIVRDIWKSLADDKLRKTPRDAILEVIANRSPSFNEFIHQYAVTSRNTLNSHPPIFHRYRDRKPTYVIYTKEPVVQKWHCAISPLGCRYYEFGPLSPGSVIKIELTPEATPILKHLNDWLSPANSAGVRPLHELPLEDLKQYLLVLEAGVKWRKSDDFPYPELTCLLSFYRSIFFGPISQLYEHLSLTILKHDTLDRLKNLNKFEADIIKALEFLQIGFIKPTDPNEAFEKIGLLEEVLRSSNDTKSIEKAIARLDLYAEQYAIDDSYNEFKDQKKVHYSPGRDLSSENRLLLISLVKIFIIDLMDEHQSRESRHLLNRILPRLAQLKQSLIENSEFSVRVPKPSEALKNKILQKRVALAEEAWLEVRHYLFAIEEPLSAWLNQEHENAVNNLQATIHEAESNQRLGKLERNGDSLSIEHKVGMLGPSRKIIMTVSSVQPINVQDVLNRSKELDYYTYDHKRNSDHHYQVCFNLTDNSSGSP